MPIGRPVAEMPLGAKIMGVGELAVSWLLLV